jgi:PucR-like helix-turn-helix protein/diguanylate cyclase with GGDEF domain
MTDSQPTVRDLLAHEALAGARVLGGSAGLDATVRAIRVASRADGAAAERGAAILLVPGEQATSLDADIALRHAAERRAAAVLLPERVVAPSVARIADRLGLPTIVHMAADPYWLAHELAAHVTAPGVARAEAILAAARAVRRAGADPARATTALSDLLGAPVGIVDGEGAPIAGAAIELPAGLLEAAPRVLPAPAERGRAGRTPADPDDATPTGRSGRGLVLAAPITLADSAPEAWVVAGPVEAGPARLAVAADVLDVASTGLAGAFARRRLAVERDARFRSSLLAELLALAGPPPPQVAERVVAAGWRTAGWHIGLHLVARGATEGEIAALTPRIEARLAAHALGGAVVQTPDGWSAWTTTDAEPEAPGYRATVRAVRALVQSLAPDLILHAGVGSPRAGARGLAETLGEARHASVLATAAGPRPAVEHAGDLGSRRLLLGWYGSEAFRAHAEALLAPLTTNGDDALLQTLEAYLDHESSASSTAAHLGLHRNTVAQRIRRVEDLLGVSLTRPDERLTVHLACRVLRLGDR